MPNCCGHCHEYVHQGGNGSVNILDNAITTQGNEQLTFYYGGEGVVSCEHCHEYVHQGGNGSVNLLDNKHTEVKIRFIECLVTMS